VENIGNRTCIGLCETEFKSRRYNHNQSFKNRKLINATELSKFIWKCKDRNTQSKMENYKTRSTLPQWN